MIESSIEQSSSNNKNKSIYALSFTTAVSFMGIGLVDPILPAISEKLHATPSEAMLLFTSYLIITAISMFFTAYLSRKIGIRKTLLSGLFLVVAFSLASSLSTSVNQIITWRAFWGLGNALFISTALAAIVSNSIDNIGRAIILYEAAIGIGMAFGPLAGGLLGQFSWRFPFAGTATLMFIGFVSIILFYKQGKKEAPAEQKESLSIFSAFQALQNIKLRKISGIALFYNMVFFILLAYSPFPIEHAAKRMGYTFGAVELGLIFFVWGLLLAFSSIWLTPKLTKRYGLAHILKITFFVLVVVMALMAFYVTNIYVLIGAVVLSGFLFGILNTGLTEAVMELHEIDKAVASSAYSGIRFLGGAISSGLAGPLATWTGLASTPYIVAAIISALAFLLIVILSKFKEIAEVEDLDDTEEANAISIGAD